MNYLLLCSAALLLPLNLNWDCFYIIKVLGSLFSVLSVKELYELMRIKEQQADPQKSGSLFAEHYGQTFKLCIFMAAVNVLCMIFKEIAGNGNLPCAVLGTVSTLSGCVGYFSLLKFIKQNEQASDSQSLRKAVDGKICSLRILGDFTPLNKTVRYFKVFSAFIVFNLTADILNRFAGEKVGCFAGIGAVISKIVIYIVLICIIVQVNKMRVNADFGEIK